MIVASRFHLGRLFALLQCRELTKLEVSRTLTRKAKRITNCFLKFRLRSCGEQISFVQFMRGSVFAKAVGIRISIQKKGIESFLFSFSFL